MAGLALLLLTDGRFPVGGYSHSGGLEAAVADGLGPAALPEFLHDRLDVVARPECMLVVAAARAARVPDVETLIRLNAEADARNPSPALRTASRRLGSQLLRTALTVWPEQRVIAAYRSASAATPRPIAFGVVAAATSLTDSESVRAYLYEEAAMVCGAAVRLLPVDAADVLRWLVEAETSFARLTDEVVAAHPPAARIPAAFAPAYELRSLAHAEREGRLFAS